MVMWLKPGLVPENIAIMGKYDISNPGRGFLLGTKNTGKWRVSLCLSGTQREYPEVGTVY